jgi:hypothetical protein
MPASSVQELPLINDCAGQLATIARGSLFLDKVAATNCILQVATHNALSPWNFGGFPGARVHSALLLMTISYNYLRYTCHNAIIFDNDAKACFDRIIPSLGLMATEQLGMPQSATKSMLATIKGMQFFI